MSSRSLLGEIFIAIGRHWIHSDESREARRQLAAQMHAAADELLALEPPPPLRVIRGGAGARA